MPQGAAVEGPSSSTCSIYRPDFLLVSSAVVPLPVPSTSIVLIGSTLPREEVAWSLVVKVGVTLWFVR
jgi:hypothetical protein